MEDLLIQILDELKNINKKLDAVTPSDLDIKVIQSNFDEAIDGIFQG